MTSIMTNSAALAALDTLRSINNDMETTQGRISSGYRVGSASDNAAYWSIATTMRSDNKALGTVSDALGLGAAKVDTAYTGMEAAIDIVSEIKAKLVAAREPGVDKDKINKELTELKNQLTS
ncbi:flagellin N-terminal helical domain-containing protein, partial [Pararhizobium sp.]|uniref:flagellin N-terminal helical domain-containing protein n=1 Tax=Pararhizobium sp. TaxID=1977563 RepID=UPI00271AE23C|nr:flagellin [Pararhizobium sp.]